MNIEEILRKQDKKALKIEIEKGLNLSEISLINFIIDTDELMPNFFQFLLKNQIKVNAFNEDGDTALIFAIIRGNTKIIKLLLEHGADVNASTKDGDTALMVASINNNNIEIVKLLLEYGADVNAIDKNGYTALILATDNVELTKLLLEHGADVNVSNKNDYTALYLSIIRKNTEITKLLLEHGADVNAIDKNGHTVLILATDNENVELTKLLLEHGADVNTLINIETQLLIDKGLDINASDKVNFTILMFAIGKENIEMVKLLIENGADVNALLNIDTKNLIEKGLAVNTSTKDGLTTLMFAIMEKKNIEIIKLLLEHEVDVNVFVNNGETALMLAIYNENIKLTKLLLEYGADINISVKSGETALMLAIYNENIKLTKLLLEYGADVNASTKDGDTALMVASINNNNIEIVKLLIDNGAKIDAENEEGLNVIHLANKKIRKYLIKKVDIEYKHISKNRSDIEKVIKRCWTNPFPIRMDRRIIFEKSTQLKWSVERNELSLRDYQYHYDEFCQKINDTFITRTLREIEINEEANLKQIFLNKGLKFYDTYINNQNERGETLLMMACKSGNKKFVSTLLEKDVDLSIENNNGDTAEMYARYSENPKEIIQLLREHEKQFTLYHPKKLVDLLTNFTIDTPIKYSTHLWDFGSLEKEYGDFKGFIHSIDKQWKLIGAELKELSPNLHQKIYNFLLNTEAKISWCNQTEISIGWSSLKGLELWCNAGNNPFEFKLPKEYEVKGKTITTFGEVIALFKREIEVRNENNMLEEIFLEEKQKLGRKFRVELVNLKGKSFYTDIERFKNVIERIFNEMKKRQAFSNIEVKCINKNKKFIELQIIQIDSKSGRNAKEMLEEVNDGDWKILKENLANLCDWSIESSSEDKGGYRINYLQSFLSKEIEELDKAPKGFTHILRFYR